MENEERKLTLREISEISGIPFTTVYRHQREHRFPTFGVKPVKVKQSSANKYLKEQGIDFVIGGENERDENKNNGNQNSKNGYEVSELIDGIARGSTEDAKLAKDRAQALKSLLEIQRRRKDDGELISVEQYRENVKRLGGMIRNLYMSIADGFLAEIDGLSPTQIQRELEIRLERFGKRLAELDWEECETGK